MLWYSKRGRGKCTSTSICTSVILLPDKSSVNLQNTGPKSIKEEAILIKEKEDGILINLKIVPNSSKNDIIVEGEFIKVKITAQPIEGKANKALVEFLSKKSGVPKSKIEIVRGETSKEKAVFFNTTEESVKKTIIALFS